MYVAVVGAGPAGLTAAYRLQQAGHRVTVIEAERTVGGRTHAEHFGPGHHCDAGAGWVATFYARTLALLDELGCRSMLLDRKVRGASDVQVDGQLYHLPFSPEAVAASPLVPGAEKTAFSDYCQRLLVEQPDGLQVDLAYDDHDAETELAPLGQAIVEYVMRPTFEGPFYSRLSTLSAAMVRSWMRALQTGAFYQMANGMDAPWLRLAEQCNVRVDDPVQMIHRRSGGVEVVTNHDASFYDGVILAVPAPAAAQMTDARMDGLPVWLSDVHYAPEVRLYAARQAISDVDVAIHVVPAASIGTVEFSSGRRGAWGACPDDWEWALVSAHGAASGALLNLPADEVIRTLWDAGQEIVPGLFGLDNAEIVYLMRWKWAVPIMGPGHYIRLADYRRTPPIVLAGDWTHQACIEGAVRSGEAAAETFGAL